MKRCGECLNHDEEKCSVYGGQYLDDCVLAENCKDYETKEVNSKKDEDVKEDDTIDEAKEEGVKDKKLSYIGFVGKYTKEFGSMKGIGKAWKEYKNK